MNKTFNSEKSDVQNKVDKVSKKEIQTFISAELR